MKKVLLALSLSALAAAGTITDPAGSAVPGANITATNTGTNSGFKTVTGTQGEHAIPSLPAATYRITVSATGSAPP